MAHTITLRAQGTADRREARLRCPASSRASMYFISPARPAAIHAGKWSSSGKSRTGAIPARSKPALRAACLMSAGICLEEPIALRDGLRSEEHTSELQSLAYLVCRLLLEKKKKKVVMIMMYNTNKQV